jgi:hypothetical protein
MPENTMASPGGKGTSSPVQNPVTAIDIVLEPDAIMIAHISVMGGYFYTANLEKTYAAVEKVLATEKVLSWKMKAFKYYYIPLKEIGLGGIVVEPTADMIRLQKKLIDALTHFMSPAGSAAAFATTASEPTINEATLNAVATYFSEHTGEHYSPHVTTGVGTVDYLNALLAAPFPTFTFSAVGVAAYQFGNFGTAAKLLRSFKLTQ